MRFQSPLVLLRCATYYFSHFVFVAGCMIHLFSHEAAQRISCEAAVVDTVLIQVADVQLH